TFDKVYSSMDRVLVHDSTYSHNNLASAAGLATLAVIDDEGLVENAAKLGAELMTSLEQVASRYELIRDIRGRGLRIGIEVGGPSSMRARARYAALTMVRAGLFTQMVVCALFEDHRVLTQTSGDHMDVLKLLPPLTTTSEHVEWFMRAFCKVMDSVH